MTIMETYMGGHVVTWYEASIARYITKAPGPGERWARTEADALRNHIRAMHELAGYRLAAPDRAA